MPGDHARFRCGLPKHAVSCSMPKDRQPLPGLEVGATVGFDLEKAGPKNLVLGPKAIDPFAEREDLRHLGAPNRGQTNGDAPAHPTGHHYENRAPWEQSPKAPDGNDAS